MKRLVLIAFLLTASVVPAASDNPTKADWDASLKRIEKLIADGKLLAPGPRGSVPKTDSSNTEAASDPTAAALDDLVKRNGVFFKKFSDVPFEGRLKPPNSGAFRRGLPEEELLFRRIDGSLRERRSYSNGRPHGLWVNYDLNGNIFRQLNYKNGKWHGPYIRFDSKGQLTRKRNY